MNTEAISENDILKYAMENGMLDIAYVQEQMQMEKRKKILNEHPYIIWKGNDDRWKTYLPDDTKPKKRRLIAKSSLKAVEDEIVDFYYNNLGLIKVSPNVTLKDIYPLWMQSRKLEVVSMNTLKKNSQDWKRYYQNDNIINIPMKNLTPQQLKDWAHKKIDDCHLNKRDYYNMAIIIKQCYSYAYGINAIPADNWSKMKINTRKLGRELKKENTTQIYFEDEKKALIDLCFQKFFDRCWNISNLTIPFLFLTGLRIGEIVALKYSDIDYERSRINIRREETIVYDMNKKDLSFSYDGRAIVEHTKTEAGIRSVPLTTEAKKIIELVKRASDEYSYYDNDYIFCPRSRRMAACSVDTKIYKYCSELGISKKSAHKIRKTYISELINSGEIDIDTICKTVGHVDMQTTFKSYCFSLDRSDTVTKKFENVITCNHELFV